MIIIIIIIVTSARSILEKERKKKKKEKTTNPWTYKSRMTAAIVAAAATGSVSVPSVCTLGLSLRKQMTTNRHDRDETNKLIPTPIGRTDADRQTEKDGSCNQD